MEEIKNEKKKEMGLAGRMRMEEMFNRNRIVEAYEEEINKILR